VGEIPFVPGHLNQSSTMCAKPALESFHAGSEEFIAMVACAGLRVVRYCVTNIGQDEGLPTSN
jgi:hypothetical protein